MTVRDLGQRMSAYELTVLWPAFFAWESRSREREERQTQAKRGRG